jgi:hypothetical protein
VKCQKQVYRPREPFFVARTWSTVNPCLLGMFGLAPRSSRRFTIGFGALPYIAHIRGDEPSESTRYDKQFVRVSNRCFFRPKEGYVTKSD